jgi:DNA-3-methyladenine glycosylase II
MMAALRRSSRVKKGVIDVIAPQTNGITKPAAGKAATVSKAAKKKPDTNTNSTNDTTEFVKPALPTTPNRRRTTKPTDPPPITPTPSAAGLISQPISLAEAAAIAKDKSRPVEPHVTNAPLITPGGSRVVAYKNDIDSSPSKLGSDLPRPSTTTGNILEEACAHLIKVDPALEPLIRKHHCRIFSPEGLAEEIDPFNALASGIISQQVSGAAARSIKRKFIQLFHEVAEDTEVDDAPGDLKFPTPKEVAACSLERLRTAGLSGRKAEYIQGLAEKFAGGELSARMLVSASTEECLEKLIAVRGLGKCNVSYPP